MHLHPPLPRPAATPFRGRGIHSRSTKQGEPAESAPVPNSSRFQKYLYLCRRNHLGYEIPYRHTDF